MNRLLLIFAFIFAPLLAVCQDWTAPFNLSGSGPTCLDIDEMNNRLIAAGLFKVLNGSTNVQGIVAFDGQSATTVNGNELSTQGLTVPSDIIFRAFANRLYLYAGFSQFGSNSPTQVMEGDSVSGNYLYFENGQWHVWDIPWGGSGGISNNRIGCMEVIDNELWAFSEKTTTNAPFRWARTQADGTTTHYELNPSDYPEVPPFTARLKKIIKWNDDYYLAGQISITINGVFHRAHILKWDGNTNFEVLATAFNSVSGSLINDMVVYNEQIVVGGRFSPATGSPANNIMKWDGIQWSPLFGSGTNDMVLKIKVFEDKLYFSGFFNLLHLNSGNYVASRIAIYDGGEPYRLSNASIYHTISDFTFFQNELYVVGSIFSVNLENFGNVARFIGSIPLADSEYIEQQVGKIWPNPFIGQFNFEHPATAYGGTLTIYNPNGVRVHSMTISPGNGRTTVSVDSNIHAGGIYYLQFVSNNGERFINKIIHTR
jgi:hypothetical protein